MEHILENYKICICTRSRDISLYKKSMSTIVYPYKRFRFLFTTADGYLYDLLKLDYDYVVNIDEDAFIVDNKAFQNLIIHCLTNKIAICGMPDGGVSPMRNGNPVVINPFFCIFNTRQIKKLFEIKTIQRQRLEPFVYKDIMPTHLIKGDYSFKEVEPFYKYFVWLALNFKTLYLDAEIHNDGLSTILKNHEGIPFLIHTWYSRFYGKDSFHTNRIENVIEECAKRGFEEYETKYPLWCYQIIDQLGNRFYFPLSRKIKRVLVICRLKTYC